MVTPFIPHERDHVIIAGGLGPTTVKQVPAPMRELL